MTASEPWRYRCPAGHTSWRPHRKNGNDKSYFCQSCDDHFAELVDMKRGESKTGVTQ